MLITDPAKHYPTWKYRYFRLAYVDYIGEDREYGVRFAPRETFTSKARPFRALGITLGHREYVFDLGKAKQP